MGKKIKKDEKGPPDDVLEPLLVESRQAATVVLMLNSPEEDIVAKACEAIYKFVDKADDNKKLLLDLGAVEALLTLIQHEERIIRRNACMALGVMTAHPEVRRCLRKKDESIQCFVNLLNPEEDTVVHEFAALGLASMAAEYSSKVTIYEHNGLEPLIACLASHDPDVQKNSIETINLLLQDYQSKAAIRELGGFPPILDLLKSEYAVIQQLALTALHQASEDCDNRAELRELEAINKLIDFIGHPEWNDLHVYAVMVISNCLEDSESIEMIKDNGGLQKLVAYITDTTPPEDEDPKKGGKKEKAASRAGKKGKDDESARATPKTTESDTEDPSHPSVDDKKGKGGGGGGGADDGVTPTLPEVKEHAAKAIARAARTAENRKLLHEQEVEKMLIALLAHEDHNVQIAAGQGIAMMAESMTSQEAIGQWDGLEPLMKQIKSDNPDIKESATLALANLTNSNSHNCSEVMRLKGIESLIELLSDTHERIVANSAKVLTNMATDEQLRSEIQRLGVINALIEPLSAQSTLVQSECALAVAAFTCDAEARAQFRESGGIEPLVSLLATGNDDTRRSASWAITVCAVDSVTATEICKYGGMEALREIQQSSTRKNAFTDVALNKLMGSNLSAKYSLTGSLSACDMIGDGFFDCGQLHPGAKLFTLEELCAMDVDQRRPIILVNAQPEKPGTPLVPDTDTKDATSKGGRASRITRKGRKSDKDAAANKDGGAGDGGDGKEGGGADGGDGTPFTPPGDNALVKYVEDVTDRIQPLPTTRDQVTALAQFVSDKLGGPIDRGQVSSFSWELAISQLKYDLKSNVVPIGMIKAGIHYHRALLFKVLCDRIAVGCTLVRGEYNRAWNVVMLTADDDSVSTAKLPPSNYIVDLVHQPGRLMRCDSTEASTYQKL